MTYAQAMLFRCLMKVVKLPPSEFARHNFIPSNTQIVHNLSSSVCGSVTRDGLLGKEGVPEQGWSPPASYTPPCHVGFPVQRVHTLCFTYRNHTCPWSAFRQLRFRRIVTPSFDRWMSARHAQGCLASASMLPPTALIACMRAALLSPCTVYSFRRTGSGQTPGERDWE